MRLCAGERGRRPQHPDQQRPAAKGAYAATKALVHQAVAAAQQKGKAVGPTGYVIPVARRCPLLIPWTQTLA